MAESIIDELKVGCDEASTGLLNVLGIAVSNNNEPGRVAVRGLEQMVQGDRSRPSVCRFTHAIAIPQTFGGPDTRDGNKRGADALNGAVNGGWFF